MNNYRLWSGEIVFVKNLLPGIFAYSRKAQTARKKKRSITKRCRSPRPLKPRRTTWTDLRQAAALKK